MIEKRIKEVRKKLKYNSRDDFATNMGIPFSTLRSYEQGKSSIPHTFLIKLNEQYSVSIDWLLTGKGEMFINSEPKNSEASGSNNNVVGFNNINGDITINEYNDKEDIKEIVELLKFVPKATLHRLKDKLNKIKEVNEDIF